MQRAIRLLGRCALVVGVVGAGTIGWTVLRSPDPWYAAHELVYRASYHRYDALIKEVAHQRGLDPTVVKAVVWRESGFGPRKVGLDGERGLMQVTEAAATEWAKSEKVVRFTPEDLFDPKMNLQAGTWLLARALHRYQDRDDPLPFALAEYNAGPRRAARWAGDKDNVENGPQSAGTDGRELVANIDIPSTRHYVETVQDRVRYYQQRGEP